MTVFQSPIYLLSNLKCAAELYQFSLRDIYSNIWEIEKRGILQYSLKKDNILSANIFRFNSETIIVLTPVNGIDPLEIYNETNIFHCESLIGEILQVLKLWKDYIDYEKVYCVGHSLTALYAVSISEALNINCITIGQLPFKKQDVTLTWLTPENYVAFISKGDTLASYVLPQSDTLKYFRILEHKRPENIIDGVNNHSIKRYASII